MSSTVTSTSLVHPASKLTPDARHAKLVEQTRKWVALSFFEPLLKEVRKDPFRSKLFDGGEGGEAFGSMYDERLAEKMTTGASNSLVNSIVRRIEAKSAYAKQQRPKMNSEREGADQTGDGSTGSSRSTSSGGGTHVSSAR
jgi:Rod binding domain-containing protein